MSYTVTIKEEITKIESTESELIAELSGYIRNNSIISKDKITMTTENYCIVERIINVIKDIFDVTPKVEEIENLNFSKNTLYQITIKDEVLKILKTLGIKENNKYLDIVPNYIIGANEEIRGYLRGAFLAKGSINDPKKSIYHMELLIDKPEESVFVQKLLNLFDLNAKILNRDKG
ncbi:MAG: DNA-binding protein WhiA, partial [Bacilli bacterium]|nr:DNA-binding protein WhiA [Bacilli bacterium]